MSSARSAAWVGGLALAGALALALAACKSKAKHAPAPAPADLGAAGLVRCRDALRRAPTVAPAERVAVLLHGCSACGQSFEPLIPAAAGHPDLAAVGRIMTTCKPACPERVVSRWWQLLSDAVPGQGELRPWRALGEDCPDVMHTDAATVRYASAAWFALALIGDRLTLTAAILPPSEQAAIAAERAAIAIPMPPWTQTSTGLIVPPGTAAAGLPWRQVTVYDKSFLVGRLAIGRLDGATWHLDAPGPPYPGAPTSGDLARDLAGLGAAPAIADRLDDVIVIAPRAAPASRAIDALRGLGAQPARFAVAVPEATALWRGAIAPHALRFAPASGPRVRVDLAAARIAAVGADGVVRASMALPDGATLRARWQAAIAVAAGHPIELCPTMPDELAVDELVELLDDAVAAGVTSGALAADGARAADADRGGFEAAAIAAALVN